MIHLGDVYRIKMYRADGIYPKGNDPYRETKLSTIQRLLITGRTVISWAISSRLPLPNDESSV